MCRTRCVIQDVSYITNDINVIEYTFSGLSIDCAFSRAFSIQHSALNIQHSALSVLLFTCAARNRSSSCLTSSTSSLPSLNSAVCTTRRQHRYTGCHHINILAAAISCSLSTAREGSTRIHESDGHCDEHCVNTSARSSRRCVARSPQRAQVSGTAVQLQGRARGTCALHCSSSLSIFANGSFSC